MSRWIVPLLAAAPGVVTALDNAFGVGRLPALGWNSWNAYNCDIDEAKFLSAAQNIVSLGLKVCMLHCQFEITLYLGMTRRISR
jgi:alpha-galactosidase